jgi:hypothetical protein
MPARDKRGRPDFRAAPFDCIGNKAHSSQFTGNEQSWNIGLETRRHTREVYTAPLRTKDQLEGPRWASQLTGTVTHTSRAIDDLSPPINDGQNSSLGTRIGTSSAPNAQFGVHPRADARWFVASRRLGALQICPGNSFFATKDQIGRPQEKQCYKLENEEEKRHPIRPINLERLPPKKMANTMCNKAMTYIALARGRWNKCQYLNKR